MGLMNFIRRKRSHSRTDPALTDAERKHRLLSQTMALAGVADNHPLWVTVLQLVDEHEQNMTDRAIEENLTSEQRHYCSGLAAGARYLANALRDAKNRADREASRKQNQ